MTGPRAAAFAAGVLLAPLLLWRPAASTRDASPRPPEAATRPRQTTPPRVPAGDDVAALRRDLAGFLDGSRLRSAEWSVLVVSLDRGDTLFARSENKSLMPASNMKVVTTAAALHFLGPSFTYQTFVLGDGAVVGDRLRGDLILYGTGDPGLSDRFFPTATRVLEELADQLAAAGLRHIDGAVVGDATYFSGPDLEPTWRPEDLNERFAAPVSALSFGENIVVLRISPGGFLGDPPILETIPSGFPLEVMNGATTVAGRPRPRLWLDRPTPTSTIRIEGEITLGGPPIWRRLTVPDPALYAANELRRVLLARGFTVNGGTRAVHPPDRSRVTGRDVWAPGLPRRAEPRILARHTSPPMIEYLTVVNRLSHNLLAETIFKTMGKIVTGQGSFAGGARAICTFTTDRVGSAAVDIRAVDGSGLSESNRVTAGGLVAILRYLADSPEWEAFLSTLPDAGHALRRMYRTPASGNLRAKTGTIDGVSALTGVVSTRDGERLLFSILSNDVGSTSAAKRVEDRIGVRLAEFERAAPDEPGS